jgi:Protein of unknown function (DUF4239)
MTTLFREPWLLFIFLVLLLSGAAAMGYRFAVATRINDIGHLHEQITGLRDGLFVLEALLIGFTIAMVLPRFDHRQDLVVEEASAIRTTILRADVLPAPQRSKTLELLREYIAVRKDFVNVGLITPAALARNTDRTTALQDELWQQAAPVTEQNQSALMASYIGSLNEMISVSEQRLAYLEHRVPTEVWITIIIVGAFQSFVAGYNLKQKFWLSLVITPVVVALVVTVIVDVDSPRTGFIHIEQNSMERLSNSIAGGHP